MSIYYSTEARGDGYDKSIGLDIDDKIIGEGPNDTNMYDYDILMNPKVGVSGSGLIIPTPPESNIKNDFILNPDGSKTYNKFLSENQKEGINQITDTINNGRLEDIKNTENSKIDIGDIVINKDFSDLSVKGILEENSLNNLFFSEMNTKAIQNTLRYRVYKNTDQVISNQSTNDLFIIMRSVMLQYANFRTNLDNIVEEIKRLNNIVLDYAVENVTSNVKQHQGYVKDLAQLPTPLDHPQYINKNNFTYDSSNLL